MFEILQLFFPNPSMISNLPFARRRYKYGMKTTEFFSEQVPSFAIQKNILSSVCFDGVSLTNGCDFCLRLDAGCTVLNGVSSRNPSGRGPIFSVLTMIRQKY